MFRVNKSLINRIFIRVTISFILCITVIIFTGRIADSAGYIGLVDFAADGSRTGFATAIYRILPSYGNLIISIFLLNILSSTAVFASLEKYIHRNNIYDWYLLLYLPNLLIYASTPSKEFLFFIPALFYIILESEHLIKGEKNKNNFFIYFTNCL